MHIFETDELQADLSKQFLGYDSIAKILSFRFFRHISLFPVIPSRHQRYEAFHSRPEVFRSQAKSIYSNYIAP